MGTITNEEGRPVEAATVVGSPVYREPCEGRLRINPDGLGGIDSTFVLSGTDGVYEIIVEGVSIAGPECVRISVLPLPDSGLLSVSDSVEAEFVVPPDRHRAVFLDFVLSPPDSIQLSLDIPISVVEGDSPNFVLTVENLRDESLELLVGAEPWTYDFQVFGEDGERVWSRLPEFVPLAASRLTMRAHERLEFQESWSLIDEEGNPVPPGQYLVSGILRTTDGEVVSETKPLTISTTGSR